MERRYREVVEDLVLLSVKPVFRFDRDRLQVTREFLDLGDERFCSGFTDQDLEHGVWWVKTYGRTRESPFDWAGNLRMYGRGLTPDDELVRFSRGGTLGVRHLVTLS